MKGQTEIFFFKREQWKRVFSLGQRGAVHKLTAVKRSVIKTAEYIQTHTKAKDTEFSFIHSFIFIPPCLLHSPPLLLSFL